MSQQLELFPDKALPSNCFKSYCSALLNLLSISPEIIVERYTDLGNKVIRFQYDNHVYNFEWDPMDCPPMTSDYEIQLYPEE